MYVHRSAQESASSAAWVHRRRFGALAIQQRTSKQRAMTAEPASKDMRLQRHGRLSAAQFAPR